MKHYPPQRSLMVAIFVLGCLLFSSPPSFAQNSLDIQENQVIQNFPNNVTFELMGIGNVPLESVTLRYGTYGRSCQSSGASQSVDIDAGINTVEATWEWNWALYGVLPQGTEFWWEWHITDESGQTFITDRQTAIVVDERFTFQRLQENNLTILWIEGNQTFGQTLLNTTRQSLTRLQNTMGIQLDEPITMVVYPSANDVRNAVLHVPEWTGGVAFPRYNSVVVGIFPGEDDWLSSVIPHELTHLVVGALVFNCKGIGVPTWLNEGLAEYGETGASSTPAPRMLTALDAGNVPALRSLATGFSAYGDDAGLAYIQGRMVVDFLISEYGTGNLLNLLLTMKAGEKIDGALEAVYGFDTDGLDNLWRQSLGYAPLPTRQPTPNPAQATTVPTISMFIPSLPATPTPTAISPSPTVMSPLSTIPSPSTASVATDTSKKSSALLYILVGTGVSLVLVALVFIIYGQRAN